MKEALKPIAAFFGIVLGVFLLGTFWQVSFGIALIAIFWWFFLN